ncbi:IS630 family transposase [Limnoglobus roseus]|uniref:IS630 family transposase n=1 Tax=Limnoglobus roseus TaxID=2598579 RepID=A0A5C1A766_9BACT|nr:IS630 family transposase [Limnoglobus roseus]QEL14113.1 IS630 family transposase [Limnoglobus roseus]
MKQQWADWRAAQPALDPTKLVFVDETWASTNMARTHGRCERGRRLVAAVPHGHWKTTFVAALRSGGMVAPTVIDGAVTGDLFVAYVEQQLAPALRRGDVVVMDNLACQKRAGVRAAIQKARAHLRYLPPYSPDLNPIELAFAKLKARLRTAERRTVEEQWTFLGQVLDDFRPTECQNYIRHCGYAATTECNPL